MLFSLQFLFFGFDKLVKKMVSIRPFGEEIETKDIPRQEHRQPSFAPKEVVSKERP